MVVLVAIVGGILLLVTRRDMLVTIVAAMLTALGTQTFFLFVGYAFGLEFGTDKMGVGGGVGMLAGFVLAAAGIIGLIGEAGYFRPRPLCNAAAAVLTTGVVTPARYYWPGLATPALA